MQLAKTRRAAGLSEYLILVLGIALVTLLSIKAYGWRLQEPTFDAATGIEFMEEN